MYPFLGWYNNKCTTNLNRHDVHKYCNEHIKPELRKGDRNGVRKYC